MAERQLYIDDMIAAIDALLAGKVTQDVQQYKIEGRELTKLPMTELMALRTQFYRETNMIEECLRYQAPPSRTIYTSL